MPSVVRACQGQQAGQRNKCQEPHGTDTAHKFDIWRKYSNSAGTPANMSERLADALLIQSSLAADEVYRSL
jgi:hypothetical protein